MHIVLQAIQILLLKKGYVEVKYDRVHNNDDSMNQYNDYGAMNHCIHRTEHPKILVQTDCGCVWAFAHPVHNTLCP